MHPALLIKPARMHAADVERGSEQRQGDRAKDAAKLVGLAYRLPDGSWIYRRHESA